MSRATCAALAVGALGAIGVVGAAVSEPRARRATVHPGARPALRVATPKAPGVSPAAQPGAGEEASSDTLVQALTRALDLPPGPRLQQLLEEGLKCGETDYDAAEQALRLLARVDPAGHAELCHSLATDPHAAVPLLAGVLVTLEFLDPAAATRVIADLARSQAASGKPVQREEIARGSLRELVRRGADADVRAQLLDPNAPERLWAAAALHAEDRLLGVGGLTPVEAEQLGQLLVREVGGPESDDDRLELFAALPFAARFEAAVARLSDPELDAELAESLIQATAQKVSDTAGAELGVRLARATQGAPAGARERLLLLQLALPRRALAPGQRREAERQLSGVYTSAQAN